MRSPLARDVALDGRVIGERELLLDIDLEQASELARPLRECGRSDEGAAHLSVGPFDSQSDDGAEELKDVLLVNDLVLSPALALDHLDFVLTLGNDVATKIFEPLEDALGM